MILQALVRNYEALAAKGEIARPGWGLAKISYGLHIDAQGELLQVMPLKIPDAAGKKQVPQLMTLPLPAKRSVDITPNFLSDNAMYVLGLDTKGKPQRALKCFAESSALHTALLSGVDTPAAQAICRFFARWQPEHAAAHPLLADFLEDFGAGANLVFMVGLQYAHEDAAIQAAWQERYDGAGDGPKLQCLVTGRCDLVEQLHPSIKGVRGAQSSGASLVSFNAPSGESYGRELSRSCGQGLNAPVSKYAAFAYGAALNHLLADREHCVLMGDTTVVYWAEGGEAVYQDLYARLWGGEPLSTVYDGDLSRVLHAVAQGKHTDWKGIPVSPDNHFYILGLAPNAARLSVRFFLQDTFGAMVEHLEAHYERLRIVGSRWETLPMWALMDAVSNEKMTSQKVSPQLSGDILRSVLTGARYPTTLLTAVNLRIRADRRVTAERAAILKAYFLRNTEILIDREVLSVELNENTCYQPYILGRLFSVLESIQQAANPGINTTVRDKYFNGACATPAVVFPQMMNLVNKHLRKLNVGTRIYYERQLGELMGRVTASYPAHHSIDDQGIFQFGYYHQTQKRFEKKEHKEESEHV